MGPNLTQFRMFGPVESLGRDAGAECLYIGTCDTFPSDTAEEAAMSVRVLILMALMLTLTTGAAHAQIPDEFTNLKVFSPDIGKRDLIGAMKNFTRALGVRCHHCHEMKVPGDFSSIDWASDSLPEKDAARGMMQMVGQLNQNLLPQAMGKPGGKVQCITCHRGLSDPRTLDLILLDTVKNDGTAAGASYYRSLREEYYGSGSYDFGPMVLMDVATTLAQAMGDTDGAMEILDLNTEMNPDHSPSYLMKSQIQVLTGDKESAIANARKALELDPENEPARKLLGQLDPEGGGR